MCFYKFFVFWLIWQLRIHSVVLKILPCLVMNSFYFPNPCHMNFLITVSLAIITHHFTINYSLVFIVLTKHVDKWALFSELKLNLNIKVFLLLQRLSLPNCCKFSKNIYIHKNNLWSKLINLYNLSLLKNKKIKGKTLVKWPFNEGHWGTKNTSLNKDAWLL